jgi:glycerol kinase
LEGSVFVSGSAIQWLRDGLGVIYDARESDILTNFVEEDDNQNIVFVPALSGLGAPYWDTSARGAIFGIERATKREHIVKATLEAIAFQSNDLISTMEKDIKKPIKSIKVDGGASKSDYLMQFQSSISQVKITSPAK